MNIEKKLQSLGLNKKQASVYFALLQLGRATAYEVANKCGLKRSTVYVVLEELRKKEAILKIPHVKKQIFIAKKTEELIQNTRNKINALIEVLPEIKALTVGDSKPKVLFFEGAEEIKELLFYKLDSMRGKEIVGFYAYDDRLSSELVELFDKYNDCLFDYGIGVRGIAPKHPSLSKYRKTDKKYNRKIKAMPMSEYSSTVSIDIIGDFVRIVAFKDLQGLIIENKLVANCMRQVFGVVWSCKF